MSDNIRRNGNEFINSLDIKNGVAKYKGSKVRIQRFYNYYNLISGINHIFVYDYSYEQTKLCFDIVIDSSFTSYNIFVGDQNFDILVYVKYKEPILSIQQRGTGKYISVLCSHNKLFVYDFLVKTKLLLTTLSETKLSINELIDEYLSEMCFDTQKSNKFLDEYITTTGTNFIVRNYNYFNYVLYGYSYISYNRSEDYIKTFISMLQSSELVKYNINKYDIRIIINNKTYYINYIGESDNNAIFYECDLLLYEFLIKVKSTFMSILSDNPGNSDEIFDNFTRLMRCSTKSATK